MIFELCEKGLGKDLLSLRQKIFYVLEFSQGLNGSRAGDCVYRLHFLVFGVFIWGLAGWYVFS